LLVGERGTSNLRNLKSLQFQIVVRSIDFRLAYEIVCVVCWENFPICDKTA
jgi:hypothetical protein